MGEFYPIRKHSDPAIQAEFTHLYSLLSRVARQYRILSGEAVFSAAGTTIYIDEQPKADYMVTITPVDGGGSYSVTRYKDRFVVSSNINGEFLWSVITRSV